MPEEIYNSFVICCHILNNFLDTAIIDTPRISLVSTLFAPSAEYSPSMVYLLLSAKGRYRTRDIGDLLQILDDEVNSYGNKLFWSPQSQIYRVLTCP